MRVRLLSPLQWTGSALLYCSCPSYRMDTTPPGLPSELPTVINTDQRAHPLLSTTAEWFDRQYQLCLPRVFFLFSFVFVIFLSFFVNCNLSFYVFSHCQWVQAPHWFIYCTFRSLIHLKWLLYHHFTAALFYLRLTGRCVCCTMRVW